MSFPDNAQMKEYKKYLEEAAKRDHRKIGKDQELFVFNDLSPGSAFFLPMGMRIYNTLMTFIKDEYFKRGFSEVGSPNIFNANLWKTSGHWQNYAEDMFQLKVDEEQFALKPMNCPGHCLIFDARERSYKELPLRFAEFGVLHRNEASGALSGLTRVRRFVQDDGKYYKTPFFYASCADRFIPQPTSSVPPTKLKPNFILPLSSSTPCTSLSASATKSVSLPVIPRSGWATSNCGTRLRAPSERFSSKRSLVTGTLTRRMPHSTVPNWTSN